MQDPRIRHHGRGGIFPAILLALAAILTACGGSVAAPSSPAPAAPSAAPSSAAPSRPAKPAATSPVASATPRPQAAQVFFTAGGKLAPEAAQVNGATPGRAALDLLLQGPKTAGHFSEIPKGTQLRSLSINDHAATVSFDDAFFAQGGASGVTLRLGQVVYTLTQFPQVTSVRFLRDGQPVSVIGEGFPLNRPLTREQFASVQPPTG
jgi:hypothetical protein